MKFNPHPYQDFAIQHILNNPAAGIFLDMGLGKTACVLTAVNELIYDRFEIEKVLIVAPKRVAEDTWPSEIAKWEHLQGLKFSMVLGAERQRKEALKRKADVYVINRENVAWLVGYLGGTFPFDTLVIDELSSFKSPKAVRFKALKMVRPRLKRVIGMTGTPSPNGLIDLWSQMYLLDMGERLGKNITGYRRDYFIPGRSNGQIIFDYKPQKNAQNLIYSRISDICISMKAKDYLTLPKCVFHTFKVKLSDAELNRYYEFEKKSVLALEDTDDISAVNAAALSNKLQQFANGAVYDEDRNVHEVHTAKLEALEEIMESLNGQSALIAYNFKHDLRRITRTLKKYSPVQLSGSEDIAKWNRGEIQAYLAHPASAGHGLNLQQGGHNIVWFGPSWSLELYMQFNARLDRQGQTMPVVITRIVVEGTIDERIIAALESKKSGQDALMNAVKAIIRKYKS
jgi:SNF2 family DNA or RNA helicase